jgi:transcriptional regulator GlxA family with amidase domain
MQIAYVVYPDFTGLDLVGPYEVISRWPNADVHFVASSPEPVRADRGLTVIPTDTPDTLPQADLIVVPGSQNPVPVLSDEVLIGWLRDAAPGCQTVASSPSPCSCSSSTTRSRRSTPARRTRPPPGRFGSRSGCCSATARSRWRRA